MTATLFDQAVIAAKQASEQRLRYLTELSRQRTLTRPEARELDQITSRLKPEAEGAKAGAQMAANAERGQKLKLNGNQPPEQHFCKTVADVAEILSVSRRTLYNYRDEGMPWKEKGAKFFDLHTMWNWLYQRENGEEPTTHRESGTLRSCVPLKEGEATPQTNVSNVTSADPETQKKQRIADRAELEKEKLRRQNRKLELETKRLEKELISRPLVEAQQIERVATVKKGLFLLVDQLPPLIVNCDGDEAKIRELMKEGVTRLMAAFSRPIELE